MGDGVGDARILTTLSEAFTLDGLFDPAGDEADWESEETAGQDAMIEGYVRLRPVKCN